MKRLLTGVDKTIAMATCYLFWLLIIFKNKIITDSKAVNCKRKKTNAMQINI